MGEVRSQLSLEGYRGAPPGWGRNDTSLKARVSPGSCQQGTDSPGVRVSSFCCSLMDSAGGEVDEPKQYRMDGRKGF